MEDRFIFMSLVSLGVWLLLYSMQVGFYLYKGKTKQAGYASIFHGAILFFAIVYYCSQADELLL